MDFAELVRSRRTVSQYTQDKVPRERVEEALALSLWAPNHRLTWPWVFTWVGPKSRLALAELAVELKSKKGSLSEVKAKSIRDNMMHPAHLIALGIKRSEPHAEHEDYATLSCSVQIASMYLWQHKIGTKWSTGAAWMSERTYEILGVDPAVIRLEGGLMVGVPMVVPQAPERPALGQFVRYST
jgi:nitroreductase